MDLSINFFCCDKKKKMSRSSFDYSTSTYETDTSDLESGERFKPFKSYSLFICITCFILLGIFAFVILFLISVILYDNADEFEFQTLSVYNGKNTTTYIRQNPCVFDMVIEKGSLFWVQPLTRNDKEWVCETGCQLDERRSISACLPYIPIRQIIILAATSILAVEKVKEIAPSACDLISTEDGNDICVYEITDHMECIEDFHETQPRWICVGECFGYIMIINEYLLISVNLHDVEINGVNQKDAVIIATEIFKEDCKNVFGNHSKKTHVTKIKCKQNYDI